MSLATSNRDGGKTSEAGHLRAIIKGLKAQVLTGLNVSQRGAGANMSVDVAIGDAVIPRSDGTYGHPAWADAIYNVAITTADVSNPRRDIVVMYIDYGQAPSTGVSNNTNGVVKIIVVPGTPAGSPSDPSNATIQSAVGASNPYIKLARVRVGAGVSSIGNSVIDDLRLMASGIMQGGWIFDDLYTWVYGSATTFTIAGVDVTSQFPAGTKLALYQAGTLKWFVVTGSAFSTNTTVTVSGMGVNTLANVPIDKPAFSYQQQPVGFPVGMTFNPVKFSARRNGAQSSGSSTFVRVNLETELYDTGSNYDAVTNFRFTAPHAGFYHFDGNVGLSGAANDVLLVLYKNGARLIDGNRFNASGPITQLHLGCDIELAAGDYIELTLFTANSYSLIVGATSISTYMNGHLISRV